MQAANPYESPSVFTPKSRKFSLLLVLLILSAIGTAVLSYMNAAQQTDFPLSSIAVVVAVPTLIQLFGVAVAFVRFRFPNRYTNILVVPAILLAIGCLTLFAAWVIAGEFQEIESIDQFFWNLCQIHPIAIPFSLVVISTFLYGLAGATAVFTFVIGWAISKAPKREPLKTE